MHIFLIDKFEVDIYHFLYLIKYVEFFLKKLFFFLFIALLRYLSRCY